MGGTSVHVLRFAGLCGALLASRIDWPELVYVCWLDGTVRCHPAQTSPEHSRGQSTRLKYRLAAQVFPQNASLMHNKPKSGGLAAHKTRSVTPNSGLSLKIDCRSAQSDSEYVSTAMRSRIVRSIAFEHSDQPVVEGIKFLSSCGVFFDVVIIVKALKAQSASVTSSCK